MSRAQRRHDTKLLSNQCGLAKSLFQQKHQDSDSCLGSSAFFEDQENLYTGLDEGANKVFKKGMTEMEQILEEKETAPDLQKAIIGTILFLDELILDLV